MKCGPVLLLVISALVGSCFRPSEERADRDTNVGHANGARFSVNVDEGLAAVRTLSDSELVLWGSAPNFSLEVEAREALDITLQIQNCLVDAELIPLSRPPGATLEARPTDDVPTRKRWRLRAPAGRLRLRLAAPDAENRADFRIALLSDVQEAIDHVGDVFDRINEQAGVRFLLGAGDLTERGRREQLEQYQTELLRLRVPYFTTLGNHELGTHPDLFHDYFGRGSFQFDFHGVFFTLVDDASASIDPTVYDWLDDWLERGRQSVHVVAMHIPPIDPIGVRNGSFASRPEAAKLLGRLAEARVDLTLYGHIHSYYDFENAGIPAYISGGGGAVPERFDGIGRHFLLIDLGPSGIHDTRIVRVDR